MYLLLECNGNLKPIMVLVGWIVFLIQMGIPIILIVLGMIDLGKAVIASKDDEIKKAQKAFGKRFIYAAAVFLVVWAVKLVLGWLPNLVNDIETDTTSWQGCWACIASRGEQNESDPNEGCHFTDTN